MPKEIGAGPGGEAELVRAHIHSFDAMRRPALKDAGAIAIEDGGITLIPNTKSKWPEKHLPGDTIFDLRADGKAFRFECSWEARNRAEQTRTDFHARDREESTRLHFTIRPKGVGAAGIVAALPAELGQPRCRECDARCPVDGTCTSCGVSFAKGFRKAGLEKVGVGLAMAVGGALVARIWGGPSEGSGSAVMGVLVMFLLFGGLVTASIGGWSVAVGPRFRLFFLTWYGVGLVVLGSFAIAVGGIVLAVKLLR